MLEKPKEDLPSGTYYTQRERQNEKIDGSIQSCNLL